MNTPQDPQPVHFSTGVTLFIMAALLCLCVYAVCIDRKEKGSGAEATFDLAYLCCLFGPPGM